MKTLYVMCGASGSGKTTLSKKLEKEYGAIRLSGDELKLRPKRLVPLIVETLFSNNIVVVDYLCTTLKARLNLLDAIKDIECKKILVFVNTSLEECIRRILLKENPLAIYMIESIHDSLEYPTLEEGWNEIVEVNNNEK